MIVDEKIMTNPSLHNPDNFPVFQSTDYLISDVPVCSIQGKFNSLDDSSGIIKFSNASIASGKLNLSDECYDYCSFKDGFLAFSDTMDCSGICWNATTSSGTNVQGCTVEGGESGIVDILKGFITFDLDLGLGKWNWLLTLLFVIIPLLILLILLYLLIRSGSS
jgi:hypothetical protein